MVGFDEEIKKILKDDPLDLLQLQTNNTISKDQRLASAWLKRAQKFETHKKSSYNIN